MPQDKITIRFLPHGDKDLLRAIRSLAAAQTQLECRTKKVKNAFQEMGMSSALATRNTRNLGKNASAAGGAFSVLRSKLLLAAFAFKMFNDTVGRFITAASDAEEVANKFDVVFGDNAEAVRAWADEYGNSIGRATSTLMEFSSTLQDTFVPLGFARDDAAELAMSLSELALDVASFNNKMDADVIRDFQSALVGNHETVRKYGIVITEASLKQEALTSGIIKTERELTNQEKVQARLNILFKGSKDAIGDLARTQDSYANQQKAFNENWKEFTEAVGEELIPVFTELLRVVNAIDLGSFVKHTTMLVGSIVAARVAVKGLSVSFTSLGTAIFGATGALKALKISLGIFAAIEVINWLYSLASANKDVEESIDPLVEKIYEERTAVNGLVLSIQKNSNNREEQKKALDKLIGLYPAYFGHLDAEKSALEDIVKAADKYNETMVLRVAQATFESERTEALKNESVALKNLIDKEAALTSAYVDMNEVLGITPGLIGGTTKAFGDQFNITLTAFRRIRSELIDLSTIPTFEMQGKITALRKTAEQLGSALGDDWQKVFPEWSDKNKKKFDEDIDFIKARVFEGFGTEGLDAFNEMLNTLPFNEVVEQFKNFTDFTEYGTRMSQEFGDAQENYNKVSSETGVAIEEINGKILRLAKSFEKYGIEIVKANENILVSPLDEEATKAHQKLLVEAFKASSTEMEIQAAKYQSMISAFEEGQGVVASQSEEFLQLQQQLEALGDEELLGEEDRVKFEELTQAQKDLLESTPEWLLLEAAIKKTEAALEFEKFKKSSPFLAQGIALMAEGLKAFGNAFEQTMMRQFDDGVLKISEFGDAFVNMMKQIVAKILAEQAVLLLMGLLFPKGGKIFDLVTGAMHEGGEVKGYATGGEVQGYATGGAIPHFQTGGGVDNVPAMLQEGEYVVRRSAVESIGVENLNKMNRTGEAPASNINVSFSGNVMSRDFIENEAIPKIKDAIRRGADIGIG